jgi:hypothetical protein
LKEGCGMRGARRLHVSRRNETAAIGIVEFRGGCDVGFPYLCSSAV